MNVCARMSPMRATECHLCVADVLARCCVLKQGSPCLGARVPGRKAHGANARVPEVGRVLEEDRAEEEQQHDDSMTRTQVKCERIRSGKIPGPLISPPATRGPRSHNSRQCGPGSVIGQCATAWRARPWAIQACPYGLMYQPMCWLLLGCAEGW